MHDNGAVESFYNRLTVFEPRERGDTRALALYSAATAVGDQSSLDATVAIARRHAVTHDQLYEIVLQSYLFLGFPRMLIAAEHLSRHFPTANPKSSLHKISDQESQTWFTRGRELCRQVYSDNFPALRRKVESYAPEVFRWMVIEGYGKVLSRPGLSIVDREMAIITSLMIDNREKQLFAHIKGAKNVRAPHSLIRHVIHDLGTAAPEGYSAALSILDQLGFV